MLRKRKKLFFNIHLRGDDKNLESWEFAFIIRFYLIFNLKERVAKNSFLDSRNSKALIHCFKSNNLLAAIVLKNKKTNFHLSQYACERTKVFCIFDQTFLPPAL